MQSVSPFSPEVSSLITRLSLLGLGENDSTSYGKWFRRIFPSEIQKNLQESLQFLAIHEHDQEDLNQCLSLWILESKDQSLLYLRMYLAHRLRNYLVPRIRDQRRTAIWIARRRRGKPNLQIDCLSNLEKQVLLLYYEEGLPFKAISNILHLGGMKQIRSIYQDALLKLRKESL